MKRRTMLGGVVAAAVCMLLEGAVPPPVAAQDDEVNFDHLTCYPIRDGLRRQRYDADLVAEQGIFLSDELDEVDVDGRVLRDCQIQVPARELCIATDKRNATDARQQVNGPPGAPPGPPAGEFLCYTVRCSTDRTRERVNIQDQFGLRRIEVRDLPSRLCAPAVRPDGPPTPTPGEPTPTPTMAGEPTPTPTPDGEPTPTPTPDGEPTPTPDGEPTPTPEEPTPTPEEPTPTPGEPTPSPGEPTPMPTVGSPSGAFLDGFTPSL